MMLPIQMSRQRGFKVFDGETGRLGLQLFPGAYRFQSPLRYREWKRTLSHAGFRSRKLMVEFLSLSMISISTSFPENFNDCKVSRSRALRYSFGALGKAQNFERVERIGLRMLRLD
jgi:hypothetical protein